VRRPRKPDTAAAEADERTVRVAALALLAGRDFGRVELATRLEKRGYPVDVIAVVVGALVAERLLSEQRFTGQFVRQRAARGHGPVRIRMELRERGVADDDIDEALEASAEDWSAIARDARRRRFGPMTPADWPERARQSRFLQYRGFSAEQIRAALGPGEDTEP